MSTGAAGPEAGDAPSGPIAQSLAARSTRLWYR